VGSWPDAWRLTPKWRTLYDFQGSREKGLYPTGNLYRDNAASLYGTTRLGGAYGQGTVFRLSPPGPEQTDWNLLVLYDFQGGSNDGGAPLGGVVMDASGTLYGTTSSGGASDEGVVFKLTPSGPDHSTWKEKVLYNFSYDWGNKIQDGAGPTSGLIMGASGALYGTTIGGGAISQFGYGYGTVFRLTPQDPEKNNWTEKVLYIFAGGEDGQNPFSGLTIDSTGALYGTTFYGGTGTCQNAQGSVVGCGTVFKLTKDPKKDNWTKTPLYCFTGNDGGKPQGTLYLDATGAIYGTTYGYGRSGDGTVFKITPTDAAQTSWTESFLYSFAGSDGAGPEGGVIADKGGQLYGTTSGGGGNGVGIVFRLSPLTMSEAVLVSFETKGHYPLYGLVADPQGNFFGTTYGTPGLGGTVFEITP
jgi:uncharacterized repeat protein (TIGR03803 family)